MKAIRVKGEIVGTGIDYYKFVKNLRIKDRIMIRENKNSDIFFYIKPKGNNPHYKQTGYKIIKCNRKRYEYYHWEPTKKQLIVILREEKTPCKKELTFH